MLPPQETVGRPRLYCGQACRQRAYEQRSATQKAGLPGVADGRGLVDTPIIKAAGLEEPERPASLAFTAPNAQGGVETRVERRRSESDAEKGTRAEQRSSAKRRRK